MILREALPQDRRMYFNKTYMLHDTAGIGYVTVTDANNINFHGVDGTKLNGVPPEELNIWFPKPAAFNYRAGAAFLSRSAKRSMKKSTCSTLYRCAGPSNINIDTLIKLSTKPHEYVEPMKAIQLLRDTKRNACAISRDIILTRHNATIRVIYSSRTVGKINKDNKFVPDNPSHPFTRRLMIKLEKMGLV